MIDFNCVCHLFSSSGMYTPKHSPLTPQPTRQQWEGASVLWWPSSISEKQKVALSEISLPDGGDVCYTGEKLSEGSALSKRLEGSRLLELGWEVSSRSRFSQREAGALLPSTPAGVLHLPSTDTRAGSGMKDRGKTLNHNMKTILRRRSRRTLKTLLGRRGC